MFFSFLTFPNIPEAAAVHTTHVIPSVEAIIDIDTTVSATYEDVVGLSVNITLTNQTDVFITSSIQALGSESAVASYRLVFDGVPFQGLIRQVGTLNGNVVLNDLVVNKPAGNYEVKVQHNVTAGTLSTINASVFAVQMHNGEGSIPANKSFVGSDSIAGTTQQDIAGLSAEITLERTSFVWVALTWSGRFDFVNQEANFTVNIAGLNMETRFRNWGAADQWGTLSLMTRSDMKLPNGTHTVKGVWSGDTGGILDGLNFSLVVIAGEANGKVSEWDINKVLVDDGTTTATALEDIPGVTFDLDLENTTHVMGFLSMDTDSSGNNRDVFFTIGIDGVDQEVLVRGHSFGGSSVAAVGVVVRSNVTLVAGTSNMTGVWRTDAATTITGMNIVLTSFTLITEDVGLADMTIVFHTGVDEFFVGGVSRVNNSVVGVTIGDVVNLTSTLDANFVFFWYLFVDGVENHTHSNPFFPTISNDVVVHSRALFIAGVGSVVIQGGSPYSSYMIALAAVGTIGVALALVMGGILLSRRRET